MCPFYMLTVSSDVSIQGGHQQPPSSPFMKYELAHDMKDM